MTTDHNEAMRLADALLMGEAMIPEIDLPEAAALLRKQAADLKSARAETNRIIALLDAANDERKALRAEVERLRTPLTDEQIDALLPKPDGSAEANVVRVEVCPGVWGKEYDEVDAWSKTLVRQVVRAIDTARKATP